MSVTPNMNLVIPTPSPSPTATVGPAYASQIDQAFNQVDSHNHTTGQGVQIPAAALNINGALNFNDYPIEQASYLELSAQGSQPAGVYTALYVDTDNNLWYINGDATGVQITSGAGTGNIIGLSLPAQASYTSSGGGLYTFLSHLSSPVNYSAVAMGTIHLYPTANNATQVVTIAAPSGGSGSLALTLPTGAASANNSVMQASTAGQLAFAPPTVNVLSSSTGSGGVGIINTAANTAISELSVTMTVSGLRQIQISFVPDGTNIAQYWSLNSSVSGPPTVTVSIQNAVGSTLAAIQYYVGEGATQSWTLPTFILPAPSAGSVAYNVYCQLSHASSGFSMNFTGICMYVTELF